MTILPYTEKNHLDFYLENQISPVRQDITDLQRHLMRRASLYRYLGVLPQLIEGSKVLEVGPGSGHNSLYVANCIPSSLDLLEPNPVAQNDICELYEQFSLPYTLPNVIPQRLEDLPVVADYDVVISESWLGVSDHERQLMSKLSGFVRPGGVLIVTLASPIGMLANTLRRILGYLLMGRGTSFSERTEVLLAAFSSHLQTMGDMSRPFVDWVQDSLLNPGFLTMHPTPIMFFEDVGVGFSIYNSFPRLHTDWRWYKSLYGSNRRFNEVFLDSYFASCHNLFNYSEELPLRDPEDNRALEKECFVLMSIVSRYEDEKSEVPIDEVLTSIESIRNNVAGVSESWCQSLEEFLNLLTKRVLTPEDVSTMASLKPIFGRELLYVSAIRGD